MPRVDPPEVVAHIWGWFWELDSGRQTGMGISLLSYSEIEAWSRLRGVRLDPFELRAIKAMDVARVSAASAA